MINCLPVTFYQESAPSFTPASLGSLIQWLTADAITGVSSGSQFGTWTDQSTSGHNATQTNGTYQPVYSATGGPNGKPCTVWNGSSSGTLAVMTCTGTMNTLTSASIFCVFEWTDTSEPNCPFGATHSGTNYSQLELVSGSPNQLTAIIGKASGSGVQSATYSTAPSTSTWYLAEIHMNGTTCEFGLNGSLQSFSATGVFTPQNIGTRSGFYLGGGIAQVIVCSPALDSTDQASVRTYLNSEYMLY